MDEILHSTILDETFKEKKNVRLPFTVSESLSVVLDHFKKSGAGGGGRS